MLQQVQQLWVKLSSTVIAIPDSPHQQIQYKLGGLCKRLLPHLCKLSYIQFFISSPALHEQPRKEEKGLTCQEEGMTNLHALPAEPGGIYGEGGQVDAGSCHAAVQQIVLQILQQVGSRVQHLYELRLQRTSGAASRQLLCCFSARPQQVSLLAVPSVADISS